MGYPGEAKDAVVKLVKKVQVLSMKRGELSAVGDDTKELKELDAQINDIIEEICFKLECYDL